MGSMRAASAAAAAREFAESEPMHSVSPRLPGGGRWSIPTVRRQHAPALRLVAIRDLSAPLPANVAEASNHGAPSGRGGGGAGVGAAGIASTPSGASASLGDGVGAGFGGPAPELLHADDATVARALMVEHPKAAAVVWARYAPMVRRMLRRAFGPVTELEDLVQDVFLLLFRRVKTLREPSTLKAFLIGITIRVVREEIRRRRVRRWVGLSADAELPEPVVGALQDTSDAREALTRFYGVLERINTRDRMAFVLHHIEGMDVVSVAAAMETSVPTVRRCLGRAWKRVVLLSERDAALSAYVARMVGRNREGEAEREQGRELSGEREGSVEGGRGAGGRK